MLGIGKCGVVHVHQIPNQNFGLAFFKKKKVHTKSRKSTEKNEHASLQKHSLETVCLRTAMYFHTKVAIAHGKFICGAVSKSNIAALWGILNEGKEHQKDGKQ